jgi:predicted nucleic acid-binding protein
MARYVITPEVALRLAEEGTVASDEHQLLAPALIRSQLLSRLRQSVRQGELTRKDADRRLDHVRRLRLRLLGDRVLQRVAWSIADQLDWEDTFAAEYVALTRLQADALVTLDGELARSLEGIVTLAPFEALTS